MPFAHEEVTHFHTMLMFSRLAILVPSSNTEKSLVDTTLFSRTMPHKL